jgi:hypothetical protein
VDKILYYSRTRKEILEQEIGIQYVSMDELLVRSDVVTLHTSKQAGQGYFTKEYLSKMKDSAIIINCSFKNTINMNTLYQKIIQDRLRTIYNNENNRGGLLFIKDSVKLKADKRAINAEEAVLISEILPLSMKFAGFREGVWVTQRNFVIPLADTLRAKAIQLYYVKSSVQSKDEKMEILYSYLSGTEFKHRVEAIIESFSRMQEEIEKEKRYFSNKWARDEKNIRQVIDNTYGMHGDLKGIIGTMLPQVRGIELLDEGNES